MNWQYFLSATFVFILCGCGASDGDPAANNRMVFVDLQSQNAIVIETTDDIPAIHPVSGERSLMPGLYCDACQQWKMAPPIEELQRNPAARHCPQCGAAMSVDGPWPEAIEHAQ